MYVFYECTLLFNLKGDISNDRDFRYIADCVASFQDCKFGPFYKDSDHQSYTVKILKLGSEVFVLV